jgi:hypothetical protein
VKESSPLYFFLGVIIIIAIGNSFIIFAEPDSKVIYSNWILITNSLIAVGLSVMILIKDKDRGGKRDRANILLALALVFWFIANIIWAYYELVLDIVSPVPSLADLFLLSAYGFLIYRLTILYKKIGVTIDRKLLLLLVTGTGLLLIYILNLTLENTTTSNFRGLMLFTVTIAYPILNSVLTVLVLIILLGIRNEKHRYIPWICELVGLLAIVIGDSWFAIIILTAYIEQLWVSALLLSAHYLLIAGGLIWYLRYSIKWHSKGIIFKVVTKVRNRNSKLILLSFIALASSLIITGLYFTIIFKGDGNTDFIPSSNSLLSANAEDEVKKEFVIGAILPFTGSLSSVGKSVKIALEKAENDVDMYFEEMNSSLHFRLLMADSKTSPEDSLAAKKDYMKEAQKSFSDLQRVLQFQLSKNMQISIILSFLVTPVLRRYFPLKEIIFFG